LAGGCDRAGMATQRPSASRAYCAPSAAAGSAQSVRDRAVVGVAGLCCGCMRQVVQRRDWCWPAVCVTLPWLLACPVTRVSRRLTCGFYDMVCVFSFLVSLTVRRLINTEAPMYRYRVLFWCLCKQVPLTCMCTFPHPSIWCGVLTPPSTMPLQRGSTVTAAGW